MAKVLLIVGRGPEVWDDLEGAWAILEGVEHHVMVINDMAQFYPCPDEVRHFYTWHAEKIPDWLPHLAGAQFHSCRWSPHPRVWHWPLGHRDQGGSSGLQACRVALRHLGYERVILAGVPMSQGTAVAGPHEHGPEFSYRDCFFRGWRDAAAELAGRVRSMSGNTRDLLGFPSREWLAPTLGLEA